MNAKIIDQRWIAVGLVLALSFATLIILRMVTRSILFGMSAIAILTFFAFWHGTQRYDRKTMVFFLVSIIVISWSYESLSIITGFPFGFYRYSDLLGPKIGLVPCIIMPAYFATGYLSWNIASILLGQWDNRIRGTDAYLMPMISAFIMVMWDLSMDPYNSTIFGYWEWLDGGAYFGVPLVNFFGWYLCVFTFYLLFAQFLRWRQLESRQVFDRPFWALPVLFYMARFIEYGGNAFLLPNTQVTSADGHSWQTGDINRSLLLVSIFTMGFVSLLALTLLARSSELSVSDDQQAATSGRS